MSKENVRAIVDANIRANGEQLITGSVLNAVLKAVVYDYQEEGSSGLPDMVEDGFAFVDEEYNIGVLVDSQGVHSPSIVEFQIDAE